MSTFNRYDAAFQARSEADGLLLLLAKIADNEYSRDRIDGIEFATRGIVRRLDRLVTVIWAANAWDGEEVMSDDEISQVVYGAEIPQEAASC